MIRRIAALVAVAGFVAFAVYRYLGSIPGYQYSGPISPDNQYAIIGLFAAFLAIVIFAADLFRKRLVLQGPERAASLMGWSLVVAGLIVTLVGGLGQNPCSGCSFNQNNSFVTFWAGLVAFLVGVTMVAAAVFASRFRPSAQNALVRWALAAIVVALIAATLWTAYGAYSAYLRDSEEEIWLLVMAASRKGMLSHA